MDTERSVVSQVDFTASRSFALPSSKNIEEVPCKLINTSGQEKLQDIIYMILTLRMMKMNNVDKGYNRADRRHENTCAFHTISIQKGMETRWVYDIPEDVYTHIWRIILE